MTQLTDMTRIEVIAPNDLTPAVRELISSAGATGYTSIAGISGVGHSGAHNGPHLFNDHDTLSMIITVLPPHRADALIDAIRTLHDTGKTFTIPSDFDLDEYMRHSVGVLRGDPVEITVRFDSLHARYARRRHWEFPHTLTDEPGDTLLLRGTVAGLEEIRTELLRWGEGVTVIEPKELREAMLASALGIAAKYRE